MIRAGVALVCAFAVAGCGESAGSSGASATAEDIAELKTEIVDLRSKLFAATYDSRDTAWLTPTEKTFSFFNTPAGQLAVSVEDVKAMGDGSEVSIRMGNLTSASIERFSFHAQWGPVDKEDNLIDAEAREGDKTLESPLRLGAWNTVSLTFAGVPPAKLGRIILSKPKVENLSLSR